MKSIKIVAAATLLATLPSAPASAKSTTAQDGGPSRCEFVFNTPWFAFMFIPCRAAGAGRN